MLRGKLLSLLTGVAVVVGLLAAPAIPAQAATGSNFDAGEIMSDSLFYDGSAMTSAQIQSFLDSKIGDCSSSDCINILRTSVSSRAARISDTTGNLVCKAFTGGTNLLVSEIIYRSQVACGISAKVILVTLQKEQGLVTSKNPSNWNLNFAMGQACPDTAPCDPAFQGIGVQILAGTTQLKTYKAARFARQPGTHSIKYNPSSSCGTKTITIKNYATAALYNYTPYTPNAAALSNLYGSGNSCSSYGNRNFWRDYTDWFGSTRSRTVSTVDTVPHLLGIDSAGELWAYPSNLKSSWLPRVSLGTSWAGSRAIASPGDLDGDGHRDVIRLDSAGNALLYRGDGGLGFESPITLAGNWSGATNLAPAGDFNGDGIPDVFSMNSAGALYLMRGTGGPALRSGVPVTGDWSSVDRIVGTDDFDGDGHSDLITRTSDGALTLNRGDGYGGWRSPLVIGSGWNVMTSIHAPGDVTGDGRPDILAVDTSGKLKLYVGLGGGRITYRATVGSGWQGLAAVAGSGPRANGIRPFVTGAGDVDGDGPRDIVAGTSAGSMSLYRGAGNGVFDGSQTIPTPVTGDSRYLSLGDFDSDGVSDLGEIDNDGILWMHSGDGAGGYETRTQIGHGWDPFTAVIGGIDFDNDRKVDIIARNTSGELVLYHGYGRGMFTGSPTVIGWGWSSMTAIVAAGDFDGDRYPDIIARRNDGVLKLYPSNGSGEWKSATQIGTGWNVVRLIVSPGDFDNAGGIDIFGIWTDGKMVLYRGNGRGGFSGSSIIGPGWNAFDWVI